MTELCTHSNGLERLIAVVCSDSVDPAADTRPVLSRSDSAPAEMTGNVDPQLAVGQQQTSAAHAASQPLVASEPVVDADDMFSPAASVSHNERVDVAERDVSDYGALFARIDLALSSLDDSSTDIGAASARPVASQPQQQCCEGAATSAITDALSARSSSSSAASGEPINKRARPSFPSQPLLERRVDAQPALTQQLQRLSVDESHHADPQLAPTARGLSSKASGASLSVTHPMDVADDEMDVLRACGLLS